jgi:hypothetical protein
MKYKMAADQVLKRFSRQIRKEDASRKADFEKPPTQMNPSWWVASTLFGP